MAKKLVVVAIVLLVGYSLFAESSNPFETLLETQQTILDAVASPEREGFCQYFETPADSNQVALTVPVGKRFVLLKLHNVTLGGGVSAQWRLTVNDNLWIDGKITYSKQEFGYRTDIGTHTFPDRCVVIDAGDILKIENTITNVTPNNTLATTIIGYYYDVP